MLAEPLAHVFVGTFASDKAQLTHGIDSGSEVPEMVMMLFRQLEMIEQMLLHILRHIVRPESYLFLRQESVIQELSPFLLPAIPIFEFRRRKILGFIGQKCPIGFLIEDIFAVSRRDFRTG